MGASARPFYNWGPPDFFNPGAGAYQYPFERFTTNPLASVYGNGGIPVGGLITVSPVVTVERAVQLNGLNGNGFNLQGTLWQQSLLDAKAFGAKAVSG